MYPMHLPKHSERPRLQFTQPQGQFVVGELRRMYVEMAPGDMPVVLMFDGPSLGGFVCPATITSSQIWKMGQVAANDTIHFKRLTLGESLLSSGSGRPL